MGTGQGYGRSTRCGWGRRRAGRGQAKGVGGQVGGGDRVVVAAPVVVQSGLRGVVLAGKPQRGLRPARVPHGGAPQGVLLVPGQATVGAHNSTDR
jgi:hypothetical protein